MATTTQKTTRTKKTVAIKEEVPVVKEESMIKEEVKVETPKIEQSMVETKEPEVKQEQPKSKVRKTFTNSNYNPPRWQKDAYATPQGWRSPKTNELLIAIKLPKEVQETYPKGWKK